MATKTIKTRIAPSPTGLFHLGTARTALFNYLFARKNKGKPRLSKGRGKFILRFEDTDQKRSIKEYEKDILDGLEWLGLKFDERIYYQTEDLKKYQKYADELIKYKCAYKKDGAIWFKLDSYPMDLIKYKDLIMSEIEFKKDVFNDFVIIKKNGIPTFMFGNAIDDYENKITHVIRGTEHINSTPQQIMIYESLGLPVPKFAHIPLILNKDRSKMSKRKNPVSISKDFRDQGYLPEAMINYLALLGWNPKTEREFFTLGELIKEFDLSKVNKSGAIFDVEKLDYFNNYYIRKTDNKTLLNLIIKSLNLKVKSQSDKFKVNEFNLKIIAVIKGRMNKLSEFEELTKFFLELPKYNPKLLIFKKSNRQTTLKGLKATSHKLQATSSSLWEKIDKLNIILLETVKQEGLTNGDVFWPLRVALSGLEKSPSPAELLWVLDKKESLDRIKLAIKKLEK